MSKKCLLSLLLLSAQLAGHAIFSASSKADSEKDLEELIGLVKQTGTKVLTSSNCEARISGFYLPPNKEGTGDRLVFCTNNIDLKDTSALWEVLAHEVAHVMQACAGGPIWKDIYHPRLLRGLKEQAPHYAEILNQYKGEDKLLELEAFDMELFGEIEQHIEVLGLLGADGQNVGMGEFALPLFHPSFGALVGPFAFDFRMRHFFLRPDAEQGFVVVVVVEGNEKRKAAERILFAAEPEERPGRIQCHTARRVKVARIHHIIQRNRHRADVIEVGL